MALYPGQKVRKNPPLGTGSSEIILSSKSLGEASRKKCFNEHPSTPLAKEKLSFPRNEKPDSARVQEKITLKNGNANARAATVEGVFSLLDRWGLVLGFFILLARGRSSL